MDNDIAQGLTVTAESQACLEKLREQYMLIAVGPNGLN